MQYEEIMMFRNLHVFLTIAVISLASANSFACGKHKKEKEQQALLSANNINADNSGKSDNPEKIAQNKINNADQKEDVVQEKMEGNLNEQPSNLDKQSNSKVQDSQVSESKAVNAIRAIEASSEKSSADNADNTAAASASDTSTDMQVLDFILTNKIESREPGETLEAFTKDHERGFAFARLSSKTNGDVTFVWYRNDHEYAKQTMTIQASKKWRTFSSVKLRPGLWKVQLKHNDQILAEKTFTLE